LLTPDAMPSSLGGTDASTVAVSGATVTDKPIPNTTAAGKTALQYDAPGSMRANSNIAPATMNAPSVIGHRGPMRCATPPMRDESRSISIVTGSSDAPASSAE
jgi:hypothetical protein